MGIFSLFKKRNQGDKQNEDVNKVNLSVEEKEKKYYQEDSYYTEKCFEGTVFEKKVVTFEERKKTAIPSSRGLYPAEILLLDYCTTGKYPGPKNGYPGFWWFEYGIRDVAVALDNLAERGFIELASPKNSVKGFTVAQLKKLLEDNGQSVAGKKADLIERVSETLSDEILINAGVQQKYVLTELGELELKENAYVPYMHKHQGKTTEDDKLGMSFNVWSINLLLDSNDKSDWLTIVDQQEQKVCNQVSERHASFMSDIKKIAPESYKVLKTQDQQIKACQKAKEKYYEDKDLDYYIGFWEHLWANGGLKFEGSKWHFELADLYIKAKRYEDALVFCKMIKRTKPSYASKAESYIAKVDDLKAKASKNKS